MPSIRVGVDPGSRNLSITQMKDGIRFKTMKIDLCQKYNKRKKRVQLIHYKRSCLPLVVDDLITKYWESIWKNAIVFIEQQKSGMIHLDFSLLLMSELQKRGLETYMISPKDVKEYAKISVPGGWEMHKKRKTKATDLLRGMFGETQYKELNQKFDKKLDDVADSLLITLYGNANLIKLRQPPPPPKPPKYSFKNKPLPANIQPECVEVLYKIVT